MARLMSLVPEHEGLCSPTWLNNNAVSRRLDGDVSGFFRRVRPLPFFPLLLVKTGPEFHGIIRDGVVVVTEHRYG